MWEETENKHILEGDKYSRERKNVCWGKEDWEYGKEVVAVLNRRSGQDSLRREQLSKDLKKVGEPRGCLREEHSRKRGAPAPRT